MSTRLFHRLAAASVLMLLCAVAVSAPPGAQDRKAPTRPTNLRVTATTAWSVSLAWSASADANTFAYRVVCSNGQSMSVPQAATAVTFSSGLQHRGTYSFYVFAVDVAGNTSQKSNTVTATLPEDTTSPAPPIITATEVGPTHAVLAWSAADDDPTLVYRVFKDGVPFGQPGSQQTGTAYLLQPASTYAFTAQARDSAGHWGPMSEPFDVTTPPADPNDHAAPSVPANLWGASLDGATEFQLFWSASADAVTPQAYIVYRMYLNGVLTGLTVGETDLTDYGQIGENLIEVTATDEAGNESAPATFVLILP